MTIHSLKKYQARRPRERFSDLPVHQRAAAEAHFQRLCARWGDDLPQWRRAILVGRAKDLAIRPRDATWGRRLRNRGTRRAIAATPGTLAPSAAPAPIAQAGLPTKVPPSSDGVKVAPLPQSTISPTPTHDVRLDISGTTTSGRDGYHTLQLLLRDLEHWTFAQSPRFDVVITGKDRPRRWGWRLVVVAVP